MTPTDNDEIAGQGRRGLSRKDLGKIAIAMVYSAVLLGRLATHTSVLFADGLRYVAQARTLEQGSTAAGIQGAVDHPMFPLAIVVAHRLIGGNSALDWQRSAQLASIAASLLLIFPLYLIARDVFGESAPLPATLLTFSVPVTVHVFADALSESTFLLFWSWGLWGALRFFRDGSLRTIPIFIGGSALAYLTRPEGLLLPAAVVATLVLSPRWVVSRLPGRRAVWVLGSIPLALGLLIGPYIAIKGGLATKPSIARLLGTAPKSERFAVERQRPLDPDQTAAKTLGIAAKAVSKAVTDALTWPLVVFAVIGLVGVRSCAATSREWKLLSVIGVASFLALLRLHATGGYCTSRHALIIAMFGFGASAFGIQQVAAHLSEFAGLRLGTPIRSFGGLVILAALIASEGSSFAGRLNPEFGGYRRAGDWLTLHASEQARVIDVTGWSQFYSGRSGYTFANLIEAPSDPSARWLAVREAHLVGPWDYCKQLNELVKGLNPVATFRSDDAKHPTRVFLYDREPLLSSAPAKGSESVRAR